MRADLQWSQERLDICYAARVYKDAPWRHQGRNAMGIDCGGLIIATGWDTGYIDRSFDVTGYSRLADPAGFLSEFMAVMDPLPTPSQAMLGDALLVAAGHVVSHVGLITMSNSGVISFLHASARMRKVLEEPLSNWMGSARRAFRYRGSFA